MLVVFCPIYLADNFYYHCFIVESEDLHYTRRLWIKEVSFVPLLSYKKLGGNTNIFLCQK